MIKYLYKNRRIVIVITLVIMFTFIPFIDRYSESAAAPLEETRNFNLIEGAKKEGEVVFYCAMSIEDARVLVAAGLPGW